MFRLAIFLLLLFAFAIGFAWLADRPGSVTVEWPWLGAIVEVTLLKAMVALAALVVAMMLIWWIVSAVLHSPQAFGRWQAGRRRDKGYSALSRGLVAAGAGDAPAARKLSKESARYLEEEPLVALLDAQTALLEGEHDKARTKFEQMLERDETKLLGLRGLYVEAEQLGETEAAAHFAEEAVGLAPATPWAARAVLKTQALAGEWRKALETLDRNRSSGLTEKAEYASKRAVLLTALARDEETTKPDDAKNHALAAHKLDPSLVPAAVTAARLSSRTGDMRKAAKILEAAWKQEPHPEIADVYVHLRQGDSALDRLKRARNLTEKRSNHSEGQYAIARAALDAGEWSEARTAMEAVLRNGATERACLLMADIEEAEHGDRGRVREWLARAVNAPRDPVWTADGIVVEEWAPVSPISGRIGAFEWKVPVEQLGDDSRAVDYSRLVHEPLKPAAAAIPPAEAAAFAEAKPPEEIPQDTHVEEADIVDVTPAEPPKPKVPEMGAAAASDSDKLTPYSNPDMDADQDGVIDRRPDDPGPQEEQEKNKALLF